MTQKRERPAGDGAPQKVTATMVDNPSLTSPKTEVQAHGAFVIEHVVTKDHFDGSPWPPSGDGWVLISTQCDWRHIWRRISLKSNGDNNG
jgi:hypothetical protein